MEQEKLQRENWIDAAKVIAILIVVLNHSGLVIPGVNFWGGMFYVPAFFLLSGYTYTPKKESMAAFAGRKAKRLLVPYFAANAVLFLFFLCKDILTGSIVWERTLLSLLGIFYGRTQLFKSEASLVVFEAPMPNVNMMQNLNAPTWFLPALFLVLIFGDALIRLWKGSQKKVNLFVAVFAFLMILHHYLSPFLLPWCLDILPFLLAFFLLGYALKIHRSFKRLEEKPFWERGGILTGVLLVAIVTGLLNGSFNLSVSSFGKSMAACMLAASASTFLLLYLLRLSEKKMPRVTAVLGKLSKHTLTIMCYHYFVMQMFFAAAAVLMPDIWTQTTLRALVQAGGMGLSVFVCVVLDLLRSKIRVGIHNADIC